MTVLDESQKLQRELRLVSRENGSLNRDNEKLWRENTRLLDDIATKDTQIAMLITTHHAEKMTLINSLERRMDELMSMHERLVEKLQSSKTASPRPPGPDKVHGIAMTIRPLRQDGAHEIRFIAGQESYVAREMEGVPGTILNFTETGNPIDLRQNFQREANARLHARIDSYLEANPEAEPPNIIFRCCRSRWIENEAFPLEGVAEIVNELLEENNGSLHLATLYTRLHTQMMAFTRSQRFHMAM